MFSNTILCSIFNNISSVVEFLAWGIKIGFIEKMYVPKAFFCILKTDIVWGLQKLGIISEYEVCTSKFKASK